jgi:hypothetical protein
MEILQRFGVLDKVINTLYQVGKDHIILVISFVIAVLILPFIARRFKTESDYVYKVLLLVKSVLGSKLGTKGQVILDAWAEGIKRASDGTFDEADKVDQLIRFLKIVASQNNIELSDTDVAIITELAETSINMLQGQKKMDIAIGVDKFQSMSHVIA